MSTKPTAQDYEDALELMIESEEWSPAEVRLLKTRAAELASQRQEPEADRIEELANKIERLQWSPEDVDEFEAALRAYAASLRKACLAGSSHDSTHTMVVRSDVPVAYLVSPNASAHPKAKEELVFDKPQYRPDWQVFPLYTSLADRAEAESQREGREANCVNCGCDLKRGNAICYECHRRQLQLQREGQQGQWMPIESAPLFAPLIGNVPRCLVYGPKWGVCMGAAGKDSSGYLYVTVNNVSGDMRDQITHYQPFPPPPEP